MIDGPRIQDSKWVGDCVFVCMPGEQLRELTSWLEHSKRLSYPCNNEGKDLCVSEVGVP